MNATRIALRKLHAGCYEYDYPRSVGLRAGERLTWTAAQSEDGTWTDHLILTGADGSVLSCSDTVGNHDRYTRLSDLRAAQECMTVTVKGWDARAIVMRDEHGNRF
jgi:hypothetical protein